MLREAFILVSKEHEAASVLRYDRLVGVNTRLRLPTKHHSSSFLLTPHWGIIVYAHSVSGLKKKKKEKKLLHIWFLTNHSYRIGLKRQRVPTRVGLVYEPSGWHLHPPGTPCVNTAFSSSWVFHPFPLGKEPALRSLFFPSPTSHRWSGQVHTYRKQTDVSGNTSAWQSEGAESKGCLKCDSTRLCPEDSTAPLQPGLRLWTKQGLSGEGVPDIPGKTKQTNQKPPRSIYLVRYPKTRAANFIHLSTS